MIEVGPGKPVWSFGVMTGTSMDEVDVALIRTDGEMILEFIDGITYPIHAKREAMIRDAMQRIADVPTEQLKHREHWPHWLIACEAEMRVLIDFACETILFKHGIGLDGPREEPWISINANWSQVCSGVHGQTLTHRPDEQFTLQVADRLVIRDGPLGMTATAHPEDKRARYSSYFRKAATEVFDFRHEDLAAGGQGAPLAPFYHFALAKHIDADAPLAFLNVGGVGNVTWVDPRKDAPEEPGALLAFDTGPGNALINDWMFKRTGCLVMDVDGGAASTGSIVRGLLTSNAARAYLRRPPPKSLDRNGFAAVLAAIEGLSINDGAATLTAFTVDCVVESLRHMPSPPTRWLVCGGGRHNRTMMGMLAERLDAPVEPVEAVGLDGDMLEAQAFAYLAVRVLRGLPTSAPSTTGCREPVCGGRISCPAG